MLYKPRIISNFSSHWFPTKYFLNSRAIQIVAIYHLICAFYKVISQASFSSAAANQIHLLQSIVASGFPSLLSPLSCQPKQKPLMRDSVKCKQADHPFPKDSEEALRAGVPSPPAKSGHAQALPAAWLPHHPGRKGPLSVSLAHSTGPISTVSGGPFCSERAFSQTHPGRKARGLLQQPPNRVHLLLPPSSLNTPPG